MAPALAPGPSPSPSPNPNPNPNPTPNPNQALQDQIDEKQRERKALKRAERARVRQFNSANERHGAALDAQVRAPYCPASA